MRTERAHAAPSWHAMSTIAVAYAGDAARAADLIPAVEALSSTLSATRLVLLWPGTATVPGALARLTAGRIDYPVPEPRARVCGAAPAVAASAAALHACSARGAIIFTGEGNAPDGPAYVAYFAGIERRAAFLAEFTGGLLTDAVPEGGAGNGTGRHRALLNALGLLPVRPSAVGRPASRAGRSAVEAR